MNKAIVFLLLILGLSACRSAGRAELDNEFETGSGISEVKFKKKTVQNLTTLAQVWGYIKYYHPNVAAGEFNMDAELFRVLPQVLDAATEEESNKAIYDWAKRFGSVKSAKEPLVKDTLYLSPDFSWITPERLGDKLANYLLSFKNADRPVVGYYVSYDPDGKPQFLHEQAYENITFPDPGYQLLALFKYWNVGQYFNPNRHVIPGGWENTLQSNIRPAFISPSAKTYRINICEWVSRMQNSLAKNDNQAILEDFWGNRTLPFKFKIIEDKAVIVDYLDKKLAEQTQFRIGDFFSSINGDIIVDKIMTRQGLLSASDRLPAQIKSAPYLAYTNLDSIVVSWTLPDVLIQRTLPTYPISELYKNKTARDIQLYKWQSGDSVEVGSIKKLPRDIIYIDLSKFSAELLASVLTSGVKDKRGIVFDLRNGANKELLKPLGEFLYTQPVAFARSVKPNPSLPGEFGLDRLEYVGVKQPEAYAGKIVVLIDASTQGDAEYVAMALRQVPNAKIIGTPSGGEQGDVADFFLPGGMKVTVPVTAVAFPDGKGTQNPAIVPDETVSLQMAKTSNGEDNQVMSALKAIN